jgi:hypothetical protein
VFCFGRGCEELNSGPHTCWVCALSLSYTQPFSKYLKGIFLFGRSYLYTCLWFVTRISTFSTSPRYPLASGKICEFGNFDLCKLTLIIPYLNKCLYKYLYQSFQNLVSGPTAILPPGNLLEMKVLEPRPQFYWIRSLGWAQQSTSYQAF